MKAKSGNLTIKHVFINKYTIKEKIGSGGTALAFIITEKETKIDYIAKFLSPNKNIFFEREVNILETLKTQNNPNIISFVESGKGYFHIEEEKNYIVLEYAPNRELYDYVIYTDLGFGEIYAKLIFSKILNGMRCLHDLNITHNDLSMSNIFLDSAYNPKIGDFGTALDNSNPEEKEKYKTQAVIGTKGFISPEKLSSHDYDLFKADIFSLGAILIYLAFGKPGFKKPNSGDNLYKLIINDTEESKNEYWNLIGLCLGQQISESFKDLYWKMVSPYPENRPSINEILNHPWIRSLENIDANELNTLNESLKKEFESRKTKAKAWVTFEIKYRDDGDDYKKIVKYNSSTRGSSGGNKKFDSQKKPKDIPDYFSEKFCIIFQDYSNANELMNYLYGKMNDKFGKDYCFITPDKDKFKMDVIFENEEDDNLEMKIKLYSTKNGLILKFFRKKGDKKGFFDKFKIISELIVNSF